MYVGCARLRDNSPRAVASSLHVSVARVPARAVRAHGKDSCWIVTLASGGAVHGGEQAVVSSAAISIKNSKPKPAELSGNDSVQNGPFA